MCLLNGEVGGTFESSIDFGQIEEENAQGNWVIKKIPIKDIIRNMVHVYAGEPHHNIIINNLDTFGLELLEYRYSTPMYLYRDEDSSEKLYKNPIIENDDIDIYLEPNNTNKDNIKKLADLSEIVITKDGFTYIYLEPLTTTLTDDFIVKPVYIKDGNEYKGYYFTKIEEGQTAGYRETDLVYAGDLIAKVGETITSVLDKIKNMLVEFEYFYNLDGQFVFQKKQSFISTMWSPNNSSDEYAELPEALAIASSYSYVFSGGELITAFNNNPQLSNIKNNYSIWGEKESITGAKIPIHFRYAIDVKPTEYNSITVTQTEVDEYNNKYDTKLKPQLSTKYVSGDIYKVKDGVITCDWREIIYQMARDYYRYNWLEDFELRVIQQNRSLYPTGRTGYESYYIDLEGFWRELYYPAIGSDFEEESEKLSDYKATLENLRLEVFGRLDENSEEYKWGIEYDLSVLSEYLSEEKNTEAEDLVRYWNNRNDPENQKDGEFKSTIQKYGVNTFGFSNNNGAYRKYYFTDDSTPPQVITSPEIYLPMLQDEYFRKKSEFNTVEEKYNSQSEKVDQLEKEMSDIYYFTEGNANEKTYWRKDIYEAPYNLIFWFDFLDVDGKLNNYSVKNIGSRTKAINETNIKSIYFRETPPVVFVPSGANININSGYKFIQVPDIESMFAISAQGKSAKDSLDELLYKHSYCNETASITAIPVYYLQPNTRVLLYDEKSGLNGDYIVNKITLSLTHNGTMTLSVTKAAESIL